MVVDVAVLLDDGVLLPSVVASIVMLLLLPVMLVMMTSAEHGYHGHGVGDGLWLEPCMMMTMILDGYHGAKRRNNIKSKNLFARRLSPCAHMLKAS